MTAQDVLNAAKGKPSKFPAEGEACPDGFACLLRPMNMDERDTVFGWHGGGKDGSTLLRWLVMNFVVDESGAKLFADGNLAEWDVNIVEAVAEAVLRRAGLKGDAGKV